MPGKIDEAFIDDLTGIYNRRFLKEYLAIEIKKYNRYYTPFTLLLLDIDNFKNVNDSRGHIEGDRVLKEFVAFLKDYLRKSDVLVRYGGDEFIIILPHTERNAGLIVAKRIIEKVKQSEFFAGMGLGVSIGVAQYPDDGKDIDELLSGADSGLYLAKRHGKGRVFFATGSNLKPRIPARNFINRENEMESLQKALGSSDYTLYLIHGDIGMGKTRFINEFFARHREEVLYGRGFSANHNFPYYVVRDILKELYQLRKSEFLNFYKELPSITKKHISRLVPGLLEGSGDISEKEEREVFLHSIYGFLSRFVQKSPVFAIDDIQWIDEESAAFFKYAALMDNNIKIIGTHRIREGSSGYRHIYESFKDRVFSIEITALRKEGVVALITAILGDKVSHEAIEYIYKNGGGNPYYVEEIIRALFENGFLYTDSQGKWLLSDSAYAESVFTPNAESIIKTKVRTLEPQHQRILELMAVYGESISIDKLSHLVTIGEGELYNILDEIERAGLIQQVSFKKYMFPAGIIRDIILKEISRGKRIYYHRKVLEYFEEFVPRAEREEKSAIIAHHYKMIGDKKKAAEFYSLAGENALKVFAFKSALRYFEESYNLIPDDEMLFKIANCYYCMGEFKESLRVLQDLVEKAPENYRYLLRLADVHEMLNDLEEAERAANFVLEQAKDEKIINGARMLIAWIRQREGRVEEAIEIYKKVLEFARRTNDEQLIAKVYQELGVCYRRIGKLEKAEEYYISALEMDYAKKNRLFYLVTKFSLSSVIFNKGYPENAIEILKELKDEFKKIGAMYYYSMSLINLGASYFTIGKNKEARKLLEMAEEYVKHIENGYLLSYIYANLANICYEEDDLKKTSEYLERAIKGGEKSIERLYDMLFLSVVYAKMGKLEKSASIYKEYLKVKEGIKDTNLDIHEIRRRLEIALITGEDISEYVNKAQKYLEKRENVNDIVYISLYIALYFAKEKQKDDAERWLNMATEKYPQARNFDVLDFHELLMEIYGYLGDRAMVLREFNLLKEELMEKKNFKRLEKLERKIEEFLK